MTIATTNTTFIWYEFEQALLILPTDASHTSMKSCRNEHFVVQVLTAFDYTIDHVLKRTNKIKTLNLYDLTIQ